MDMMGCPDSHPHFYSRKRASYFLSRDVDVMEDLWTGWWCGTAGRRSQFPFQWNTTAFEIWTVDTSSPFHLMHSIQPWPSQWIPGQRKNEPSKNLCYIEFRKQLELKNPSDRHAFAGM